MNQADTAWMLMSTALVLLMTPALAFFYGGLVRSKNALNTMMMSFISLGFVGVLWALLGYSLAFTTGNDWLGDMSNAHVSLVSLRQPKLVTMEFWSHLPCQTRARDSVVDLSSVARVVRRSRLAAEASASTMLSGALVQPT